ncbi:MAG: alpha-E domain-containing protein [Gammaproteobacteria bacterium]|nr:alpha-E domain-containing protein [Gammaproteobacteria bacterium]
MLSRVANSVYWMNRYLERAGNMAHFIDVNIRLMMEMGLERETSQWKSLMQVSGDNEAFSQYYQDESEESVVQFLTFDKRNPNSIISCIEKARENARTVREIIPWEQWEAMNRLHHLVQKYSRKRHIDNLQSFYEQVKNACCLYSGLSEDAMSHDEAWHFSRLGRMLERADKTTRILDVKYFLLLPSIEEVDSPYDAVEWGAVLRSAHGLQMYRRQFHRIDHLNVTHFLIFDQFFPRSINYCVNAAMKSLENITQTLRIEIAATEEMAVLCHSLKNTTAKEVINKGLHEFLDMTQFNLNRVGQAIYESFFTMRG